MFKQKFLLLKFLIFIVVAGITITAHAQQNVTLAGKVVDSASGAGIAGVSVTIKSNNRKGTVTDGSGNFKITAPQNSVLVVSSVNYKTVEAATGNSLFLNVTLVPYSSELNEVV